MRSYKGATFAIAVATVIGPPVQFKPPRHPLWRDLPVADPARVCSLSNQRREFALSTPQSAARCHAA